MALTVVFVLIGSLMLSFTVIPAMIAAFITKPVQEKRAVCRALGTAMVSPAESRLFATSGPDHCSRRVVLVLLGLLGSRDWERSSSPD